MNRAARAVFHGPACGTSCNTPAQIRNSRVESVIVEYLKKPPPRRDASVGGGTQPGARMGQCLDAAMNNSAKANFDVGSVRR